MTEVIQADRDAAAAFEEREPPHMGGEVIRDGMADDLPLVQAFARHRIAAIAAARPMIEAEAWQPIETAPRDGRYIIAARFNEEVLRWVKHSRWITADEIADIEGGPPGEYDAGWTDGDQDDEPAYPTHWMPLPAPPSIEPQS